MILPAYKAALGGPSRIRYTTYEFPKSQIVNSQLEIVNLKSLSPFPFLLFTFPFSPCLFPSFLLFYPLNDKNTWQLKLPRKNNAFIVLSVPRQPALWARFRLAKLVEA